MNKEIFAALTLLEKEKGIPVDFMINKISKSIVVACKSNYSGNDDAIVKIDVDKQIFEVYLRKTVVEEVTDKGREISLNDARNIDPGVGIGEKVNVKLNTKDFGRIAAQTARNMIRQGIRDGEREQMLQEFQSHTQEIVTAQIDKIDDRNGSATLKIGKSTAVLPRNEQIPNEILKEGMNIKVFVVDVKSTERGPKAVISRSHPDFVKRLFEKEVPEIYDGLIEIKSVSREAGSRTKIAVLSHSPEVDAIGSCIGARGIRVSTICNELNGEKIDIIEFNEDPIKYICSAISPAQVSNVEIIDKELKLCKVIVPDNQLSLAIGNKGQNVRLAARLTGWKIDINPLSEYEDFNAEQSESEEIKKVEELEDNLSNNDNEEELKAEN